MLSSTKTTTKEDTCPRRRRHNFTKAQLNKLEASFDQNDGYIDSAVRDDLAQELDLDESHIRVWFQNQRARFKRHIKPTTSSFVPTQTSEIRDAVAQPPAMEMTAAKQSTCNRQLLDLSNPQLEQSVLHKDKLRKGLQSQQTPCYKQSHTTEIRKPEADSLYSVTVSLDGRSENTCKRIASDVTFTGLLGKPKLDNVSNQISMEAPNTGIADEQASSPLMVYNVHTFSPTPVSRVLPVKENPRDHYDGSHVKETGAPHLPRERPSANFGRILTKPVVSPSLSERHGQGHPQDGDGCSFEPSSKEQLRSRSGNNGMCLPHVPMSRQLPSKSAADRTPVVSDRDIHGHEGLLGEIMNQMLYSTKTTKENTYPRRRIHFTRAQLKKLEATFNKNHGYINTVARDDLAQELDVDRAQVTIWFQNRRAKFKRQIKSTTSSFVHPKIQSETRDAIAQSPAMETAAAKEGLPTNPCYKHSHATENRKPEADSLSSVEVSLDGRSETTCKSIASDVNFNGLRGEPKLDRVSNQITVEAPNTGIADKQASSPLMVYDVQTFSPTAVPRVLPVKENPRDHSDSSHVKETGATHLPRERPANIKSAVSPPLSERRSQGPPQYGDGHSNVPSSNEQLRFHSENIGMCLPHVPMSSKFVVDRTPKTVVPDKDTLVHEGLPGEITIEPTRREHLNTDDSLDTIDPNIEHRALHKVSFFSAMCDIDVDWAPLPDDVSVMFSSYRESPDCSKDAATTEAMESAVVEMNVYFPKLMC